MVVVVYVLIDVLAPVLAEALFLIFGDVSILIGPVETAGAKLIDIKFVPDDSVNVRY